MYDVFISYRREGGYAMARLLYERFSGMNLHSFFDFEELQSGHFDVKIYQSIEESQNFVLVLPANALDRCNEEGDWLRLEIEHAIAKEKNIIPVMMSGFFWPKELPESLKTLPSYNGVQMSRDYFDASITRIVSMLVGVGSGDQRKPSGERTENIYYTQLYSEDNKEKRRLKILLLSIQSRRRTNESNTHQKVGKLTHESGHASVHGNIDQLFDQFDYHRRPGTHGKSTDEYHHVGKIHFVKRGKKRKRKGKQIQDTRQCGKDTDFCNQANAVTRFHNSSKEKSTPAKNAGVPKRHNEMLRSDLLSSGLYRRCRNYACSALRLVDFTTGVELHQPLKICI